MAVRDIVVFEGMHCRMDGFEEHRDHMEIYLQGI